MTIKKSWYTTVALVVLAVLIAVPASAERLTGRTSQGNNIGWSISTGWGMPFTGGGRKMQFPKGSGNFITNDGNTIGFGAYRDIDGDGVYEDTSGMNHMRSNMPGLSSLEQADLIHSLGAALGSSGLEGEAGKAEYNRIWSSLDAAEVAEWPPEGRTPRTWSGTPDIAAAGETMFFHSGETFNSWGYNETFPLGVYQGWTLRFLDFAESNNIMYIHQYVRNMSEYMVYNGSANYRDTFAAAGKPEGIDWAGLVMVKNNRNQYYNGARAGWAVHWEKEITTFFPKNTTYGGWSPPPAPMIVLKMVNYPEHNGETMKMSSFHTYNSGDVEFGFQGHQQMYVGYRWSTTYQVSVDRDTGLYSGTLNPFTGRPVIGAFPGKLTPDDERFDQWIWGGASNWQNYTSWGELHDVAPRDSFEFDMAVMFPQPGLSDWVMPDLVAANMDDPLMQDLLAPAESWSEIAEVIINGGFQVPVAPTTPPLTIVPGDRQVSLTWSDLPLQTPDPFYNFLQDNPSLDPDGVYREFDFEGFRVYRSFVGPNDSHSELLGDFNLSGSSLQFHYIDKREDDEPFRRMRNGQKVWYAVVAYDSNVDPATGSAFSLPDPAGGKVWNRPGEQIYQVIPRSESSEYRAAEMVSYAYEAPAGVTASPSGEMSVTLAGDGTLITQDPVYIPPVLNNVSWEPIVNERITSEETFFIQVTDDMGPNGRPCGSRHIVLANSSGTATSNPAYLAVRTRNRGSQIYPFVFDGNMNSTGAAWTVGAQAYMGRRQAGEGRYLQAQIDAGGYTGATVDLMAHRDSRTGGGTERYTERSSWQAFVRNAAYEITWSNSGGNVTVSVTDRTHGSTIPFSPYIDDVSWGFVPPGVSTSTYQSELGVAWGVKAGREKAKSTRTTMLVETLPADNTEPCALWIGGEFIHLIDAPIAMPANGTVMVLRTALGRWDGDGNWTQGRDVPMPGDKWKFTINPMSNEAEDADLSRIKVVPNPYMASSFLDLSPANRRIEFVNLPSGCTIRIYTLSGNLVNVLNHVGINRNGWGDYTDFDRLQAGTGAPTEFTGFDNHTGTEPWNLRNRFGQIVASGLYLYHVTDQRGETFTGKFYVVN
jgi:hypothetical protein